MKIDVKMTGREITSTDRNHIEERLGIGLLKKIIRYTERKINPTGRNVKYTGMKIKAYSICLMVKNCLFLSVLVKKRKSFV